jgi:predicted DNA-binding protein with PD1-like motif
MKTYTFRLKPNKDLFVSIENFCKESEIKAGCVLACVGSLRKAAIRLANKEVISTWEDKFEIVSLTGTVSTLGSHLHISISDGEGQTIGGHLVEGNLIYTTAEIVIAAFPELIYKRELCGESGYPELVVEKSEDLS